MAASVARGASSKWTIGESGCGVVLNAIAGKPQRASGAASLQMTSSHSGALKDGIGEPRQ